MLIVDIPKGAVTGKNHDEAWSPRSGNGRAPPASPDHGPTKRYVNNSPRLLDSPDHEPDVKAADSPRRQWDAENEIPKGVVSSIAANRIFFAESPETDNTPQLSQQKKQWDANKDIPRGKVKGMSNLFAGGNVKRAIPENHMEPVDPPGPSPANPYQTEVIKPTPIAASRSEDETSPLQQQTIQEVHATSAFYMANENVDNNAWTVPVSSSGSHFGQGTWGEEAALSHSNDEFDDQDWFQAGSFNEEDKKTESELAFSERTLIDRGATALHDVDDDDDADLHTTSIGSFAAAIQPVTLRRQNAKPETVAEELEEDDAGSDEVAAKAIPSRESDTINIVNKITRNQAERELLNAHKLQKLLENTTDDEQPGDVRSTTSKNSKASKGTLLGFRKKSPMADEVPEKKRRGGLFKIFSRKDQPKNEESRWLKAGSDSSTAPPAKLPPSPNERTVKSPTAQKAVLMMNVPEPTTTIDSRGSLNKLTEDLEKERAKGIISTRDDMTAVSEMTNPTVFLKQVPSDSMEEKIMIAKGNTRRDAVDEKVKVTKGTVAKIAKQWPPQVKTFASPQSVEEENSANLSSTVDPFDIHSPMFSNGDPFASPKELDSLQISADDPFTDPFFDTFENELRSGSFAVEPILGGSEHVSVIEEYVVEEGPKHSFQASKPLAAATVMGKSKYSFDVPDPEIELLSSDDEAENNDPATGHENIIEVPATKVDTQESPTKAVRGFDAKQNQTPDIEDAPMDEIMEMENEATISIAALSRSGKANTSGTKPLHRSNKSALQRIPSEKPHRNETMTMMNPNSKKEPSTDIRGIPTSRRGKIDFPW